MNQDKYINYIQQGKDPYKEEFNKVAEALDKVYMSQTMTDELKLLAYKNIAESVNNRPHACGKVEDKKQLKLDM